jgi:hypothetical protein
VVKVIGPLHSVEARGRLGANEYGTWRGINYVKGHVDPRPAPTQKQLDQRDVFKALTLQWAELEPGQRELWNSWAAQHSHGDWTGKQVRMSGFNAYLHFNAQAQKWSLTQVLIPPPDYLFPAISSITKAVDVTFGFYTLTVNFASEPDWGVCQCNQLFAGPGSYGAIPDFHYAVFLQASSGTPCVFSLDRNELQTDGRYGFWMKLVNIYTGQQDNWHFVDLNDPWNLFTGYE